MPDLPKALVLRSAGTNCDAEMCRAFQLAGASVDLVHMDRLIADPARLADYDLIGFPGGFSYGDDIAAGRVFGVRVREHLYPALKDAVNRGALIIGACNGFQVLVQTGLLPGCEPNAWPDAAPEQQTALAANEGGRFIDRWVRIAPVPNTKCLWTQGLEEFAEREHQQATPRPAPSPHGRGQGEGSQTYSNSSTSSVSSSSSSSSSSSKNHALPSPSVPSVTSVVNSDLLQLPIAHGEGRFVAASPALLNQLESNGQIALRYASGDNPNGSQGDIAGICDPSGRVFGLMPHPERYLSWHNHPYWTRLPAELRTGDTPGLRIFKNAVAAVSKHAVA